jgi:hypothetical protein
VLARSRADTLSLRCDDTQPYAHDKPQDRPEQLQRMAIQRLLVVYNGVTRATRIARLAPGATIRVEVVGKLRRAYAGEPKIGDQVP